MPGINYFPSARECEVFQQRSGLPLDSCMRLLTAADGKLELALAWIRDGQPLPCNQWFQYYCPSCGTGAHKSKSRWECSSCGWLKYPTTDRNQWDKVGRCPDCGFSYRWDGYLCSHCGHGTPA